MTMRKRGAILIVFSSVLLFLSAFVLNSVEKSGDPLFYYTLNSFFVSLAVFALPACFFMCKSIFFDKHDECDFFLNSLKPFPLILCALLGISVFLLGTVCSGIFKIEPSMQFRPALSPYSIFTVCIIPALSEEIFFRSVLLSCFSSFGKIKASLLVSFIFAVMHTNAYSFLSLFCIGMLLSFLAFSSRSLLSCITFHIFYNLAWLVIPTGIFQYEIFLIFSAIFIIALCIFIIYKLQLFFKGTPFKKFSVF